MAKIVFKEDKRNQLLLFPPDLGSLIPDNHLVRVVDRIINDIDLNPLIATYKGGGTSSFCPRMMLKVITYGYIEKIYTNRRIEKALRENINFMWLSGMSTPDHGTIHNFRSVRMKEVVDDVFSSVVEVLIESGYIKAENLFVDGTKIEANASRYSYVWRKNVERQTGMVKERVSELLKAIDQLQQEEDAEYGIRNLEEIEGNITSEKVEKLVDDINQKLTNSSHSKAISSNVKQLQKNYLPRMKKYESQSRILGGRNSCSKTDHDATFFRMKEDHLNKGQLKPGYNVQIATENQFILGYGVYQKADDTSVFIPFLEKVKNQIKTLPNNIVADAGYGSEENYDYIIDNELANYVKYNNYDYEKTSEYKNRKFLSSHFVYEPEKDQYTCPEGQILYYSTTQEITSDNGYKSQRMVYQSKTCSTCLQRGLCCKGQNDRTIHVSPKLIEYKLAAKQNLESEKGIKLRAQRGIDVESVFGQIKHNNQFRRFYTHGLKNVNTEWGIISIAHNIKKMAN
jgi:transposase